MTATRHSQAGAASGPSVRFRAAGVLIACIGVLGTAAWLTPDPQGLGTHEQLGLAACAWRINQGSPCPTCGMTTAFSLAAHGRLLDAFIAQPAAAMGAMLIAMTGWIAAWVAATGCAAAMEFRRLPGRRVAVAAILIVAAAWIYKLAVAA